MNNWKNPAIVVVGVTAGFIGGSIVYRDESRIVKDVPTPEPVIHSAAPVTAPSVEVEQQVAALQSELDALRRKAASDAGAVPVTPESRKREETAKRLEADLEARNKAAEQRETDKLLAAGFTQERVEWLRRRGEERDSMAMQTLYERKHKGLPVVDYAGAYIVDKDLDLINDIGEIEYDRYRQAQGKLNSVNVVKLGPGSIAERAGLKPGDEVLRYDGKRVYNTSQLNAFAADSKPGESVPVEVRRGGQTIQMSMASGPPGVEGESMIDTMRRETDRKLGPSTFSAPDRTRAATGVSP